MDSFEDRGDLVIRINKGEAVQAFAALQKRKAKKYRKYINKRIAKFNITLKAWEEKNESVKVRDYIFF
jgi:hypothetical protein